MDTIAVVSGAAIMAEAGIVDAKDEVSAQLALCRNAQRKCIFGVVRDSHHGQ